MSALFSPIKLADLTLANRIVVSPMCQYSADDGSANDWHLGHLGMLANSGAALLVVEATHVERRGRITHGCLGLYSDDNEAALARVIAHCRRIGTAKQPPALGDLGLARFSDDDGTRLDRILAALRRTGNQAEAAKQLGMSRRTLITRLDAYQIERPRKGRPAKS